MTGKIAVTPRSLSGAGHPVLSLLTERGFDIVFPAPGRTPSEDDLLRAIPGCVGWLAGVEPIGSRVLAAADSLRVISRNGTGTDNIDMGTAIARGIRVERAQAANARGVAELAIALMLAGFRQVPWSDARMRDGKWDRRLGREAEGRRLAVIGCGAIGRQVARIALGLGMEVVGHDPYPQADFAPSGFRYDSLAQALTGADAVSLHCPPGDKPLLNDAALSLLVQGAVVVNTARAELIDDAAMLAALDKGQLSAFATDVFPAEPPALTPLLRHDRTILTPHAGGFTVESVERATRAAVENLLRALAE